MGENTRTNTALERLLAGNRRYVTGARVFPDQTPERRRELAAGQQPFAAVLGCSDSRVAPEIIFDEGLGALFVVRVAGHVVDSASLGSLEYAVQHLSIPLILVLGHSGCGAVQAAIASRSEASRSEASRSEAGRSEAGGIAALVAAIGPAVERARGEGGALLENAVRANAALAADQLRAAPPVLASAVAAGALVVLGGVYDLVSGRVALLD